MANQNSLHDDNNVPSLNVANSSSPTETLKVYGDPSTNGIHVYVAGSAVGGDDINVAQVNGQTVNVGTGAAGTGTMRVTTSTDSTIGTLTGGGVASGASDSGNPVKVGGVFNTTQPTLTNGQRGDVQMDSRANVSTTLGTLISGEDQTNNVMRVEGQFTRATMTSATTTTHKSGSGLLHSVTVNKAVATATITMYDNTAGSGTVIGTITFGAALLSDPPICAVYDVNFSTGLTVVTSGATDVTFSYR